MSSATRTHRLQRTLSFVCIAGLSALTMVLTACGGNSAEGFDAVDGECIPANDRVGQAEVGVDCAAGCDELCPQREDCTNGIDDDFDGSFDCNDSDCAACEPGLEPILHVDPADELAFELTPDAATDTQVVDITNAGQGALTVTAVTSDSPGVFDVNGAFPVVLSGAESITVPVVYTHGSDDQPLGELLITSSHGSVTLDLIAPESEPTGAVFVAPDPIDFGIVAPGSEESVSVVVQNVGAAPLLISNIALAEQGAFWIETNTFFPSMLQPTEFIELDVSYLSESDEPQSNTLLVSSDDPVTPSLEVPITANVDAPCLYTSILNGHDFGQRLPGGTSGVSFTIRHCAVPEIQAVLVVSSIEWLVEDPAISIVSLPEPLPNSALSLNPSVEGAVTVEFTPSEERASEAILRITSNAANSPHDISFTGSAVINRCPIPVALCRRAGDTDYASELTATTGETIECDGTQSSDAEGEVERYQWIVIERPDGSTSPFSPDGRNATPTFDVDAPGRFVLRLSVIDDRDLISCEPDDVIVTAEP